MDFVCRYFPPNNLFEEPVKNGSIFMTQLKFLHSRRIILVSTDTDTVQLLTEGSTTTSYF